jgi:biofilm PGA synthesis N-glycosyltransferase PgaC
MTHFERLSAIPVRPRIALVTPLRDEENYIDGMITSIAQQEMKPVKWIIVDDGSTDSTPAIVLDYCKKLDFLELVRLPIRTERRPGGEGAIATALQKLKLSDFDYLARFDADLLFPSDYFARMLAEFARDPRLGIAGGGLYVKRDAGLELERAPSYHVRGALKMYRRECFEQLGGLSSSIGWDTIDEVYAWSKGWRSRSFMEVEVIHRRPTGEGLQVNRIYRERGRAEYLTWSHPVFVLLKALKLGSASPRKAASFLRGFIRAYRERETRLQDAAFIRTRRRQQLARLSGKLVTMILND